MKVLYRSKSLQVSPGSRPQSYYKFDRKFRTRNADIFFKRDKSAR